MEASEGSVEDLLVRFENDTPSSLEDEREERGIRTKAFDRSVRPLSPIP
jgi:hypothetical protein